MEIARDYLGNVDDNADLAQMLASESCWVVRLQESDRRKGRIHAQTNSEVAVGIIKDRNYLMRSGDLFKTDSGRLLLVELQERELLVLDLDAVDKNIAAEKLVQLGHTLGNHHYPITLQDNKIYVQLVTDKATLEKIIEDLAIANLNFEYQTRSDSTELTFSHHRH